MEIFEVTVNILNPYLQSPLLLLVVIIKKYMVNTFDDLEVLQAILLFSVVLSKVKHFIQKLRNLILMIV